MNNKNQTFRNMLNDSGSIFAAGVYDAVSARIAESVGFKTIYMTGNGATASLIGKADIGLMTMTEMVSRGRQIAQSIQVPLICDADTGYGNINNVRRTVQEYEAAGVSAIHLEDQITPKKCGAMEGLALISAEEMVDKIKVALDARNDPNFTIIARTDSASVLGVDEALRRCKIYADAGADVVFPEMIHSLDDIKRFTTSINAPIMYDILEMPSEPMFNVKDLENAGVKIIFNCLSAMFVTCHTLTQFYTELRKSGSSEAFMNQMMGLHEYEALMGLKEENMLLERVLNQHN